MCGRIGLEKLHLLEPCLEPHCVEPVITHRVEPVIAHHEYGCSPPAIIISGQ